MPRDAAAGLEKMGVDRNLPKTGCWVGRRSESAPRSSSSSSLEERFRASFRKVERAAVHQLSTSSISLHKITLTSWLLGLHSSDSRERGGDHGGSATEALPSSLGVRRSHANERCGSDLRRPIL